jgi:formiminotetrahydrofolate cyclodeaminase
LTDYANEPLHRYLDDLASRHETPGGGSVSGLVAALAAGLGSMVCHFTVGKKKYAAVENEIKDILSQCDSLRLDLLAQMQRDVDVFQSQMATAYGLPKDTAEQAAVRESALQAACKAAAAPPMTIARQCRKLMTLLASLAEKGSTMLVSDTGCAAALAKGAFDSAAFNVQINVNFIKDKEFASALSAELEALAAEIGPLAERVLTSVRAKMAPH